MSVVCGRPRTTARSVPWALLPVTRLVTMYLSLIIWSFFSKLVNMFKIQATGLAGPKFRTGAYHGSEPILQSSCWSHGGDYISVLVAGFMRCWQMVASDRLGGDRRLWVMVDMVRSGLWMHFCISPANRWKRWKPRSSTSRFTVTGEASAPCRSWVD